MKEAYLVADQLAEAITSRDANKIRALYDDDIVVWHPAFGSEMGKAQNSELLGQVFALARDLRYEEVRRHPIDGGLVQQHVLTGTFTDGAAIPRLQVCMILHIRSGLIIRIEEYFDAATFGPVWERLPNAA